MIVHTLPDGQLLCIHQNSHALMAAEFCRHWGNRDFARPAPDAPVLLGIALHDNGWMEWEAAAQVRDDGYPMDFLHGPSSHEKLAIWQRGVARAFAQHPYAGLLVGQHAAALYAADLDRLQGDEQAAVAAFIAEQEALVADVRKKVAPDLARALSPVTLAAHTRLLQFGDTASLQVCMPWGSTRTFAGCPVDFAGETTEIHMAWEGTTIHFTPWPVGVDRFSVSIHGRRLATTHFASHAAYQAALDAAPYGTLSWDVVPG